jgi:putative two-component system response regulator
MNRNKAKVLIVDDEIYIQEIVSVTLQDAGFECVTAANVADALESLESGHFDVAFIDIRMPGRSGTELLQEVNAKYPGVVIIMLTAIDHAATAVEAMRLGAYDYIVKPFNLDLVLIAANRALEKRRLEHANLEYQKYLEQMAEDRAAETRRLFYQMTQVLVRLLELKMPFSIGHHVRVAEMSRYVARELRMTEDGVRRVYLAALLHDVGMMALGDGLLGKPGALSPDEQQQLRERVHLAEVVLKPILDDEEVLKCIRHKQEKYDGSGYPDGLKGNLIPLGSRIIAVAEAFDAMTQDRPYRQALSTEIALAELARCADSQFDGQVVTVFTELYDRFFHRLNQS